MALDVAVPDAPSLSGPSPGAAYSAVSPPETAAGGSYRRDELEELLEAGAWADGFEAWAAGTDLAESEFARLIRHDILEQLDFYWDPVTEEVGYRVPSLPDDASEALSTDPDDVESELDALARTVSETLESDYRLHGEW